MSTPDRALFEFVSTAMSTTVSVQLVGPLPHPERCAAEVFDWFRLVEAACSRFDPQSELVALCDAAPTESTVSPVLFEVLRVALAVADASHGAFDPTLGALLHARGFDKSWRRDGKTPPAALHARATQAGGTWRDIVLHEATRSVTLSVPVLLDLGGVAKGFALDLSARALAAVADCCVVAGGDLFCRGHNAAGRPWRTAVVNPFASTAPAAVLTVEAPEYAVCTSGDYARRTVAGHHLLDARHPTVQSAGTLRSVTVIAPQAAVADALATAVFVLGVGEGTRLLEAQQADGLLIAPDGHRHEVRGWGRTTFEHVA